jgi:ABC-2 type transport system permease protein
MRKGLAKAAAYYKLYLLDIFVYWGAAFLWIIIDCIKTILMPLVWIAAAGASETVGSMHLNEIVAYYVGALVLSQLVTSHLMWDMAYEIREGVFSIHLVRPISYFWSQFIRNAAWRVSKLIMFVPVLLLMVLAYRDYLTGVPIYITGAFLLSIILAHVLSYCAAFVLGLFALRTQEAYSIIHLYYLPEMFLSGRLFPMELLPGWAATMASLTPFRMTVAFPLEIMLGRLDPSAIALGLVTQVGWILAMCAAGVVMWRTGLKMYTGVGM